MCRKSVWMGIGWMAIICLFLSCSDEKTGGPEPLGVTFPEAVQKALNHYFPDQEPSSAEELNEEAKGELRYLVAYGTDACIIIDEEGEWQFVESTVRPLPEVLKEEYAGQFQTIAQSYPNEEPISLQRAAYGVTVGLMNGELFAFEENSGTLLGNELMGYEGKAEASQILPNATYSFVYSYFSEYPVQNILQSIDKEISYKVYLDGGLCVSFDTSNQWSVVESLGEAFLPSSFLASLPDAVKELMTTDEVVRVEQKIEPETIQYYVEATGGKGFGVAIDNPNHPIQFPDEAINAFIETYFGIAPTPKKTVYVSDTRNFRVSLPNGFDFTLDEAGEWLEVDGNGTPLSEMKQLIIEENILQQAESEYQTTITFVQKEIDQLVLRDEAGNAYIYKDNTFQRLEGIWEPMEKAYRYIRSHYPEDFDATFIYYSPDEGIIYQLGNGEKVRFDGKGNVL